MVSTAECVYELNSSPALPHQLADERGDNRGLPCSRDNDDQRIIFRAEGFVHRVQLGRIQVGLG